MLMLVALACVLRWKNLHREFSAYYAYLWVAAVAAGSYVILRSLAIFSIINLRAGGLTYFYISSVLFLMEYALIFCLVRNLYREATSRVPGVQRLGNLVFHWIIGIAALLALSAGLTPHPNLMMLVTAIDFQIQRSACILVLCLVVFLAFAAQKLGITYGSRIFGISFGLAMLATERMVSDALVVAFNQNWLTVNLIGEFPQIFAISLWMVYFLKAEPERKLVTVPIDSPLIQWNEVAKLLGNPGGQVVVSAPSTFTPDVRDVPAVAASGTPRRQGFGVVS